DLGFLGLGEHQVRHVFDPVFFFLEAEAGSLIGFEPLELRVDVERCLTRDGQAAFLRWIKHYLLRHGFISSWVLGFIRRAEAPLVGRASLEQWARPCRPRPCDPAGRHPWEARLELELCFRSSSLFRSALRWRGPPRDRGAARWPVAAA